MPYEEFSFWDKYECDQNRSPHSCGCFWQVQGEQDFWDKYTVSFILERKRARNSESGNATVRHK